MLRALPLELCTEDTEVERDRVPSLPALCQHHVRGVRRGDVLRALIAELGRVDLGEKGFPGAEEDRSNGKVHLVDQTRAQLLPNRRNNSTLTPIPLGFASRRATANLIEIADYIHAHNPAAAQRVRAEIG